jgi:hypothetical protein
LRDEVGDGRVEAGFALEYGSVHRDNVAAFILAALRRPTLSRALIELNDGPTPADTAVESLDDALRRPHTRT